MEFTKYVLDFLPLGSVPLDTAKMYGYNKLQIKWRIDFVSGLAWFQVGYEPYYNRFITLFTDIAQVGIPIPLSQLKVDNKTGIGLAFANFVSDVIKNVDEAVRIRVYKDDQFVTYAKAKANGAPEKNTIAFESSDIVAVDHVENFSPGDKIKYTIVLWIEGSDLECTDNILGGEFKVQMNFNSEFVDEKKEGKKK